MSEAVIRRAGVDDAPALAAFAERTFRETFAADNNPDDFELYVRSAFGHAIQRAELCDPNVVTLILDAGAGPAGYAQLWTASEPEVPMPGRAIELRRFYIDRPWHGRGLARTLMAAVEREAADRGAVALWLGVWEQNRRAIAFYRKCGFLDVGSHVFVLGRDPQTDRIMMRPVAGQASPRAPECLYTARLHLRRPRPADAQAIFDRYAGDADVTRYVGWPRHASVDDTRGFLAFSDAEWEHWPAGPYVIVARDDGTLLGSTGLGFETPFRASTGYVLARDAWGRGFATEALAAMVDVARVTGVERLYALCHTDHRASAHVLEKGGFARESTMPKFAEFPNLTPGVASDVFCYVRLLNQP
jgi:RimJ/RimL family protein N-acetyltransferase